MSAPNWPMVVYARIDLRSRARTASTELMSSDASPTVTSAVVHSSVLPRVGYSRAHRYTPSLTIVAECR